ncbi:putative murein hydrolase (TIGR00659 family) [Cupriavidus metallidurans]|jgi:predicted murein hydrolase (TIGR00659 family)|uniref:Effector of murein hydrolase LrgB n=2 Tax=Cupriavidus metallidurans TaxID=119219 RepID=Q1LJ72_CUPMC|nr:MULTISPECIES: LrgB family protein [Cupriavidus]PCH54698.1 MAG: LrgB family protein [Burkholderiaceae bacterium]HBD39778.1 LrgB family protein [Cupriavidus sp.]ABF09804.1 effector of murein hydrolase LrgB [Cupriavidus metallidurans CH34]AVA36934.1 LrgB family protein [Cupriavidus metallidurans]ELA00903.1 effector of murein hydrolase LrgB [Cupriavidus sp. HMR-1]
MMSPRLNEIWVYLAASPLIGLTATLIAYVFAFRIYERARFSPLANPVMISVAILVTVLTVTGTPYKTYFDGAQFVHFLLGPATVALAVPLYTQLPKLRTNVFPLLCGLVAGSFAAVVSAVGIAYALGATPDVIRSLAPKSVTIPIAMGVSEKIGGLPSLTAVLVMATGIIGAVTATGLLNLLRVRDYTVRGFATGVAAHGIGTARAFQVSQEAGAFSALGMGLNGVLTAIMVPVLAAWMPH